LYASANASQKVADDNRGHMRLAAAALVGERGGVDRAARTLAGAA
jgi:hypothetical protein